MIMPGLAKKLERPTGRPVILTGPTCKWSGMASDPSLRAYQAASIRFPRPVENNVGRSLDLPPRRIASGVDI